MSDRLSLPWLMPLGPALGGLGVALAGVAPSYALTFAAILLSGIGVAAFHPEGSRFANYVSGARRASGMSLFSVGGNIGFALGPVLVTPLLIVFGLHGTAVRPDPDVADGSRPGHELPRLKTFRPDVVGRTGSERRPPRGLGAVHVARGRDRAALVRVLRPRHIHPALLRERPTHEQGVRERGARAMLLGGAAGTLIGGPLADRFGRRTVLIGSMPVLPPLVVGFLVSGAGGSRSCSRRSPGRRRSPRSR